MDEQVSLDLLTKGWDGFLSGSGRGTLERALPAWLAKQRWFGAKTRSVAGVAVGHWAVMPMAAAGSILPVTDVPAASTLGDVVLFLDLTYTDESSERYQLPLAYSTGAELALLRESAPSSLVLEVTSPTGPAAFHDATARNEFRQGLLSLVEHAGVLVVQDGAVAAEHIAATLVAAHEGRPAHDVSVAETRTIASAIAVTHSIEVRDVAPEFVGHMPGATNAAGSTEPDHNPHGASVLGEPSTAFKSLRGEGNLPARIGSAEQSNTNILYGQQIIMKMFRRLQPGLNPDIEIGRFLTDVAHFDRIAPFLGEITWHQPQGERTSLAMVQGLVANEGDGWAWTQGELAAFYQAAGTTNEPRGVDTIPAGYLAAAELLGRRTAEMHVALATPTADQSFAAEPFTEQDFTLDAVRLEAQIATALDALQAGKGRLSDDVAARADVVLAQRVQLLERARAIGATTASGQRIRGQRIRGQRIRIHGDYHLGQILRTKDDFVLLDFEGEPAKTLEERRRKQSPLRDVAGMLRSFSYAAASALNACAPELRGQLAPWARAWEDAVSKQYLHGYADAATANQDLLPEPDMARRMLEGYRLEKALYELLYELNNRPAWVGIPLSGILNFLELQDRS